MYIQRIENDDRDFRLMQAMVFSRTLRKRQMKLHELKNTFPRQNRKRVGRGDGSGHGRTAGRGEKGAGARTGHSRRPYFEGGQIPLIRRLPKRGFNNPNHTEYVVVNLDVLENKLEAGIEVIDRKTLQKLGLIGKTDQPLKILGNGDLTKKLTVVADKFSKSAREKIEALGGICKDAAEVKAEAKKQAEAEKPQA